MRGTPSIPMPSAIDIFAGERLEKEMCQVMSMNSSSTEKLKASTPEISKYEPRKVPCFRSTTSAIESLATIVRLSRVTGTGTRSYARGGISYMVRKLDKNYNLPACQLQTYNDLNMGLQSRL